MSNLSQPFNRKVADQADLTQPQLAGPVRQEARVVDYYSSATSGYQDWSRNINMHFGYYQWGMNPFDLEAMLENTNRQVFESLHIKGTHSRLLDMGCGLGATARFCAAREGVASVTGITLVESQVREATALVADSPLASRLRFERGDYHHTPFADESFDGTYAVESACHSVERDKRSLLQEAHRLLKPGGRFVICDGFIRSAAPLNAFSDLCYRKTCEHWSLGHMAELDGLLAAMRDLGFKNIEVRDITLRMLPSAAFIPAVALRYFCKLLWSKDQNPQHWHHLLAPLWGFFLGLNIKRFGYYLISGEK